MVTALAIGFTIALAAGIAAWLINRMPYKPVDRFFDEPPLDDSKRETREGRW